MTMFFFSFFKIRVYKRNDEHLLVDCFFISSRPLLDWNPNSGRDDGSIPTFDDFFSFFGECCLEKKSRTRLDLLSIPQSGGENVKTFRWDHRRFESAFSSFLDQLPPRLPPRPSTTPTFTSFLTKTLIMLTKELLQLPDAPSLLAQR